MNYIRLELTANSRFAKAGVSCFYDSKVLNSGFVHLLKFNAKKPRLRKAAKRCTQPIFMHKILLFLLFLFAHRISFSQFIFNDTLFFVRDKNDEYYHKIFIDTNKKSEFYSYVSDFTIANFDIESYKRSLDFLYSKKLNPRKQRLENLPREWVLLETYKSKTYVYSPNDFYFHYKVKLTDSIFIDWTGEGPEANYIQKFTKINSSTYVFNLKSQTSLNRELTIKYIDREKGIAIFRDKFYNSYFKEMVEQYHLMGDVQKMRNIPLLVNICDNLKQYEPDFDKVDLSKLFKNLN
jgi:hypothetical protein